MIKDLEGEIASFKGESLKQRKVLYTLEKEREKYGAEASDANAKFAAALEEVKLREMTILDLQKKIAEGDSKLKQQQGLYEAVRSDRNLYSKNLVESQDEIAEMKRKLKIMNHQMDQLKEEIKEKDATLIHEHSCHTRVQKNCETIKDSMEKAKKRQAQLQQQRETQASDLKKLGLTIQEAETERVAQKKSYEQVISERDVLASQLIRRNDELALLYE